MHIRQERRLLQAAIFIGALVPVSAGLLGMVQGAFMLDPVASIDLDSHVRYLSALLLGIGLTFWGMIPRIEKHTSLARLLTAMIVLGGTARLIAVVFIGMPSMPMVAAIGMEIIVTPLLCCWQGRVARHWHTA